MKLSVLNIKGKETGRSVELSKSIFEVTPNDHAVYLDVKRFLANNRQGTNKTKERAEITEGLLRYCELDTLAMVMIVQAWKRYL